MTIQLILAILSAFLFLYTESLVFIWIFSIFMIWEMVLSVKRRWLAIKEWVKAKRL